MPEPDIDAAAAVDHLTAAEAWRINLANLFDPMMAVHTSNVEPLPHQITAVYESMLPRQPLRYVLADDPGAGKTIMAGLFIRELLMRADETSLRSVGLLDGAAPYTTRRARYQQLVDAVAARAWTLRPGARVVTFHGFGGTWPRCLARVACELAATGDLELWVRVS